LKNQKKPFIKQKIEQKITQIISNVEKKKQHIQQINDLILE